MRPAPVTKRKDCKSCGGKFHPFSTTQKACSPRCALDLVKTRQAKESAKVTRKMRTEFNAKDRSYQLKMAQQQFNAYIRERDKNEFCISCGEHHKGQYHAGHLKSIGSHPELRFEEMNCHKQCSPCNNHLSGNILNYRKGMVDRYGLSVVEWIEGPHEPKNYSLDEIIEIKNRYRAKLKALVSISES